MRRPKDKVIAGIDLHGNNVVIGIINQDGKRLEHKKVSTELALVESVLKPYKGRLSSMAVESTFNWYWLVDGLRARGYPIDLANPAKIEQYNGIKHADDKHDAFHLAELQRLGILPKAYIYDPKTRPVRDLLRRRLKLVHHRSAHFISFKSLYTRTTGGQMPLKAVKSMSPAQAAQLYEHPSNQLIASIHIEHTEALDKSIKRIERAVLAQARTLPVYPMDPGVPGLGAGFCGGLPCGHIRGNRKVPTKRAGGRPEPQGLALFGSKGVELRHRSNRARTRWVTERIAS